MEYFLYFLIYLVMGLPVFLFVFAIDIQKQKNESVYELWATCLIIYLLWLPLGLLRLIGVGLYKLGLRMPTV